MNKDDTDIMLKRASDWNIGVSNEMSRFLYAIANNGANWNSAKAMLKRRALKKGYVKLHSEGRCISPNRTYTRATLTTKGRDYVLDRLSKITARMPKHERTSFKIYEHMLIS